MSNDERRRYFRITETVGLLIRPFKAPQQRVADTDAQDINGLAAVFEHDKQILSLIDKLASSHPDIAELTHLLNQKMSALANVVALDNSTLDRIAQRVQEVNISACGLAFHHGESLMEGAMVSIELTLFPSKLKICCEAVVVGSEPATDSDDAFYCRLDFIGMRHDVQEQLIQHIVQSQSNQLKARQAMRY